MTKRYLTKTTLSAFCLGLSFAGSQLVQADTWDGGGDGSSWEDDLNWTLDFAPGNSADPGNFTADLNGAITVDRDVVSNPGRTYVQGGAVLNVNGAGHSDGKSGNTTRNFIGNGSTGTVNVYGPSTDYGVGHVLAIAHTNNSIGTVKVYDGATLNVFRGGNSLIGGHDDANLEFDRGHSLSIGGNSGHTNAMGLLEIDNSTLLTRVGVAVGTNGTFSVIGSSGSILLGGSNVNEGWFLLSSTGTLKAAVDAGGITPIFVEAGTGGTETALLQAGSLLDVSFDAAPVGGTWTLLEVEGKPIVDEGIALAPGVDTSIWSFAVDNSGSNGKLTITSDVPEIYWDGQADDGEGGRIDSGIWDYDTTNTWAEFDLTPITYTEPTGVTFDDYLRGTSTVDLTTTFSNVNVTIDSDSNAYNFTGIGAIAGNAALTKGGSETLTISNTGGNNFDGGIAVNEGALILNSDNTTSALTFNDTAVTINGSTSTGSLTATATSALQIGTNGALTINGSADFSGILTGDGSMTIDDGSNTKFTYNADTTYTGPIVISDGILNLTYGGGASALGNSSIQLGDDSNEDATLYFPTRGSTDPDQVITVAGGGNNLIWGGHNHTGQTAFIRETVLVNADLTIRNTANAAFRLDGGDAAGGLYGTGNVRFEGNGNGNAISIRQPVNNVGTITNAGTGTNPLNFVGSQGGKIGVNVTGIIQDSATSAFEINATSDFTGTADVISGTLRIFDANGLDANNVVTIDTAGILDVQNNVTIAGLNDATGAGMVMNQSAAGDYTLTIGGSGTYTFSGLIADGTPYIEDPEAETPVTITPLPFNIAMSGAGSQTLGGDNTYTGFTQIGGSGTLVINHVNALGTSIIGGGNASFTGTLDVNGFAITNAIADKVIANGTIANNGAAVDLTGMGSFGASAGRTMLIDGTGDITFDQAITGNYSIIKNGSNTVNLSGLNTYNGTTTVNTGSLVLDGTSLNDAGSLILNGGTVAVSGSETVDTLFLGAVQQDAGTYTNSEIPAITSGSIIVVSGPVIVEDPYDAWAISKGLTPGVNDGPNDDEDNDGSNLYEYFFWDSNPLVAEVFGSEIGGITLNSADVIFTHDRPKDISDVVVTYQWTTDLSAGWTNSGASDGTSTVTFTTGTTGAPANGNTNDYESVEVTGAVTAGAIPAKAFVRVTVEPVQNN